MAFDYTGWATKK